MSTELAAWVQAKLGEYVHAAKTIHDAPSACRGECGWPEFAAFVALTGQAITDTYVESLRMPPGTIGPVRVQTLEFAVTQLALCWDDPPGLPGEEPGLCP